MSLRLLRHKMGHSVFLDKYSRTQSAVVDYTDSNFYNLSWDFSQIQINILTTALLCRVIIQVLFFAKSRCYALQLRSLRICHIIIWGTSFLLYTTFLEV